MQLKKAFLIIMFCLMVALPLYAQDATAEPTAEVAAATETVTETAEPPAGLPLLVLLIGVGAVGAISVVALIRQRTTGADAIE